MLQEVKEKYNAFSYIEVLIVVALLSSASLLFIPLTFSQISSGRVEYYASDINSVAFGSQQDSYSHQDGSAHGIRFNTDSYDVFTGDSYATATSSYTITMDNDVEFTNVNLELVGTSTSTTELIFDRGDYKPNADGTVVMSDGNNTYQLVINEEGLIYYEKI